jgi:hypothetical protein
MEASKTNFLNKKFALIFFAGEGLKLMSSAVAFGLFYYSCNMVELDLSKCSKNEIKNFTIDKMKLFNLLVVGSVNENSLPKPKISQIFSNWVIIPGQLNLKKVLGAVMVKGSQAGGSSNIASSLYLSLRTYGMGIEKSQNWLHTYGYILEKNSILFKRRL